MCRDDFKSTSALYFPKQRNPLLITTSKVKIPVARILLIEKMHTKTVFNKKCVVFVNNRFQKVRKQGDSAPLRQLRVGQTEFFRLKSVTIR